MIYQSYLVIQRKINIENIIVYWSIVLVTIIIFLILIIENFSKYYINNWILNAYLIYEGNTFFDFYNIRFSLLTKLFFYNKIIILLSISLLFMTNNYKKILLIYIIVILITIYIFIAGSPFNQNYLYLPIFLAISASYSLRKLSPTQNYDLLFGFIFLLVVINNTKNTEITNEKEE